MKKTSVKIERNINKIIKQDKELLKKKNTKYFSEAVTLEEALIKFFNEPKFLKAMQDKVVSSFNYGFNADRELVIQICMSNDRLSAKKEKRMKESAVDLLGLFKEKLLEAKKAAEKKVSEKKKEK